MVVIDPDEVDATERQRVASNNSNVELVYNIWRSNRVCVRSIWKEQEEISEHLKMD
jgi:hypothetical protein